MDLTKLTITEAHRGLVEKKFSALELTKAFFDKIAKEDKKISSYLTISKPQALSEAEEVDEAILEGREIPILAGIPFAVKDNILVKDIRCTAGSKILENYIAPYDATVIKRLKEQKAIVLGKTNLDEFAMGSSTENSAFFTTKNPYDLARVPGGSSGGSAAATKADLCVFSLGSDTGGSIRQPASFCGVVGLKPTYGSVSRYGLIAFGSSLDQIGPITKDVEDARIVFNTIRGKDEKDSTSIAPPKIENQSTKICARSSPQQIGCSDHKLKIENLKIGLPKEYFREGLSPKIKELTKKTIKEYEKMGAEIVEVSLPHTDYALPCYCIISFAEASANLARYDGIRYSGLSLKSKAGKIKNLLDVYLQTRGEGFGDEVKRRIMLGTYTLSAGYYEAYYKRAQKVRTLIKQDFEKAFKKVDCLVTPVSPFLPFKIGERTENPLSMYLADAYTVSVSLAGLPAISLPVGEIDNLPVGIQIIGNIFEEDKILDIAQNLEKAIAQ